LAALVPRTGRRPGPNTSRAAILAAAQARFAAAGFDATSLRAIAADAGVDVGVVLHFFGSKDDLFRAAVGWPFDPEQALAHLAVDPGEPLGMRLAHVFFSFWDDPTTGPALAALLRSAMTNAAAANLLREFVVHELLGRVAGLFEAEQPELRIELAAAQLVGVAMLRHILRVEPLCSASLDELVARVGPTLEAYRRDP
jgi:AcrR family transcriptional regulator